MGPFPFKPPHGPPRKMGLKIVDSPEACRHKQQRDGSREPAFGFSSHLRIRCFHKQMHIHHKSYMQTEREGGKEKAAMGEAVWSRRQKLEGHAYRAQAAAGLQQESEGGLFRLTPSQLQKEPACPHSDLVPVAFSSVTEHCGCL